MSLPGLNSARIRNAVHRILDPRGAIAHYLWESIPIYGTFFDELPLESDMRILDVGCGVGRTTLELAHRVPQGEVVGIDINPAFTACAEQLTQVFEMGDRVKFFAGDIVEKGTIPKGETFDFIYIRHVISDLKAAGIKRLTQHLKAKAILAALEPDFTMCRAFQLPHLDAHYRREGQLTLETGLSGGNLRHLLHDVQLKVDRFELRLKTFTEKNKEWVVFAKKRLAAAYKEEIPKVEAMRFRRGSQWVDERIGHLEDQVQELNQLTRRHRFTHLYVQFLAQAHK